MTDQRMIADQSVLKRLFAFLKPYRGWIFICLAASLLNAGVDLYVARLMQQLIDTTMKGLVPEVIKVVTILFGVVAAGIIAKYLISFSTGRFSLGAIRDIRNLAVAQILRAKMSALETDHSGAIVSRLTNNLAVVQGFLESNVAGFFYLPVVFIGTLLIMGFISWKMLLINVLLIAVTTGMVVILGKPLEKYSEELQAHLGSVNSIAQDAIRGIPVIKAFNLYHSLSKKYQAAVAQTLEKNLAIGKRISLILPVAIILQTLPLAISIMYGGYLTIKGQITPSGLIVNIYLLDFLANSITGIPQSIIGLNMVSGAAVELFKIMNKPAERTGGCPAADRPAGFPIELNNVSFSYDDNVLVLDNVSLKLARGEKVALVGPSGSGKSTIVKLLCGFYEPGGGQIFINGSLLNELELSSVRSLMTIVSQDVVLFPATITENIAYGRSGAGLDEIRAAARAANIDQFISQLPEGYHTPVGEKGTRLSGGEKQRIAIARAIIKNTPIMLLDEPTSSLDNESEALIQEALGNLARERTTLIVAHRLSSLKNVDRILVLDRGKIVETGTHEQLMAADTLYKRLYLDQYDLKAV